MWQRGVSKNHTSAKGKKVTVVTVTHDVEFAADISDRCGMLFDGEILAVETPHNFFGKIIFIQQQ